MHRRKEFVLIDSYGDTVFKHLKNTLRRAHRQLLEHKNEDEATHQCALGVLYLYCSNRRWERLKRKQAYSESILQFNGKISEAINVIENEKIKPNFFYQYLLNRDNPDHNRLFKLGEDEKPCLGCIISGIIQPK